MLELFVEVTEVKSYKFTTTTLTAGAPHIKPSKYDMQRTHHSSLLIPDS